MNSWFFLLYFTLFLESTLFQTILLYSTTVERGNRRKCIFYTYYIRFTIYPIIDPTIGNNLYNIYIERFMKDGN